MSHVFSHSSNYAKKNSTEEAVTFPILAMLQEELVFWIPVWFIQCCFPNKFQNNIKSFMQVNYVVAETEGGSHTSLTNHESFAKEANFSRIERRSSKELIIGTG